MEYSASQCLPHLFRLRSNRRMLPCLFIGMRFNLSLSLPLPLPPFLAIHERSRRNRFCISFLSSSGRNGFNISDGMQAVVCTPSSILGASSELTKFKRVTHKVVSQHGWGKTSRPLIQKCISPAQGSSPAKSWTPVSLFSTP